MPRLLQLSDEEVQIINARRAEVEQPYIDYMKKFIPGQFGEIALDEGEDRRLIRRKISMAANRAGLVIQWRYDDATKNSHDGRFVDRNIFKVMRFKGEQPKKRKSPTKPKIPGAGTAAGID